MAIGLDELKEAAAKLTVSEQAELAYYLIQALDSDIDATNALEVERAWQIEIQRRVAEIDRGEVELIPGDEVFARLREKFRPEPR